MTRRWYTGLQGGREPAAWWLGDVWLHASDLGTRSRRTISRRQSKNSRAGRRFGPIDAPCTPCLRHGNLMHAQE
jgi:hypothetical protein